jgi:hypothetical protein
MPCVAFGPEPPPATRRGRLIRPSWIAHARVMRQSALSPLGRIMEKADKTEKEPWKSRKYSLPTGGMSTNHDFRRHVAQVCWIAGELESMAIQCNSRAGLAVMTGDLLDALDKVEAWRLANEPRLRGLRSRCRFLVDV